jgi:hypothetical protein
MKGNVNEAFDTNAAAPTLGYITMAGILEMTRIYTDKLKFKVALSATTDKV